MSHVEYGPVNLDWMFGTMEKVRQRMLRATRALEAAGIPYAVAGGNAVAAWVSKIDPSAVRTTQDVDLLVRRGDFERVKRALEGTGFEYHPVMDVDTFVDTTTGRVRDAVHLLYANERVKPHYSVPTPDVSESQAEPEFQVVGLEALVRMKLTSNRDKDRAHVRDMIELGMLDSTWLSRVPADLAERLESMLNTPGG